MKRSTYKYLAVLIFIATHFTNPFIATAQQDSIETVKKTSGLFPQKKITYRSYLIPAGLIASGTAAAIIRHNDHKNDQLIPRVKEPGLFEEPANYTALAPAGLVLGLNLIGVKGKHKPAEQLLLYAAAGGMSTAIVYPLKNNTHILRPDGSDYHSFPSGHTALAFVSAELLRREYSEVSPWYGVAGYASATATAVLRVVKGRHSVGDVLAGAGIGMASTTTVYWLYDKIKTKRTQNKTVRNFLMPSISRDFYGIYFTKIL